MRLRGSRSQQDVSAGSAADERPGLGRWRAAVAGALAIAVMIGISQAVAALLNGGRSLVLAVGDVVIDTVPGWLERAVISWLGTADKPFLIGMILLVAALLGAALGVLAVRRFALAAGGLAGIVMLGVAASLSDPQADAAAALVVGLTGALAAIATLWVLLRATVHRASAAATQRVAAAPAAIGSGVVDRRRFVQLSAAAAAVAVAGAACGRMLVSSERIEKLRQAIRLPRPTRAAAPPPPGADLEIRGLTPLFVPNDDFYRIDTALRVPQVDPADWSLQVKGLVKRPFSVTYDELMAMAQIEADITLACVSNEVGGGLVGNARWQGVPLYRLLERAGLKKGATQVIGRSVDGFTAGFPTLTALDVKEAMVAVAMNGEPLPARHGFPARLVVPGLYGYVSATKWLSSIELTDWDADGYWIPRGWAKKGPIKTQSRIDVPAAGSKIAGGRQPIAGVAWAPTRGIDRVEVSIDGGPWLEATLAAALDVDAWRQWFLPWDPAPGRHVIAVRATDGLGDVQTDKRTPVAPDGAAGRHSIEVVVV